MSGQCICNQCCNQCVFRELCTPWEKLLDNSLDNGCSNFTNINNFYLDEIDDEDEDAWNRTDEENIWREMSWNKYVDKLYNYIEDN